MATNKTSAADRRLKLVSLPRICKFKIHDQLRLMVGKNAGHTAVGELTRIDSKKGRVWVKGVNMIIKHVRRDPNNPSKPSGRVAVESSIHVSNVALVCPKCMKPTRVGWKMLDAPQQGKTLRVYKKLRVCKRCHEIIDTVD